MSNSTSRRARLRSAYTGEPHQTAFHELRSHRGLVPHASSDAQRFLEARTLSALVAEFGAHHPGALGGPFALSWVGPREDSLLLSIAEPHRERVLRRLLSHLPTNLADGQDPEPQSGRSTVLELTVGGGALLFPADHREALATAKAAVPVPSAPAYPAWMNRPDGQGAASTVLRRIRLFAESGLLDFSEHLPAPGILDGPHPEQLHAAGRPRIISVCNASGGHGCTSLAAGLAEALSQQGHRVLLLGTAIARPGQRSWDGNRQSHGHDAQSPLGAMIEDPAAHLHQPPGSSHTFANVSADRDGEEQARQLALLLRHPDLDARFTHVVIDASPTGLPAAAASGADLVLVPWRNAPTKAPGSTVTERRLTERGEIWTWLSDTYQRWSPGSLSGKDADPCDLDEDDNPFELGAGDSYSPSGQHLDDLEARIQQQFLDEVEPFAADRWGAKWPDALAGWAAHLQRMESSPRGWDTEAGAYVTRELSAEEQTAAAEARVAQSAGWCLDGLPPLRGRHRYVLVPTTDRAAQPSPEIRAACNTLGHAAASTTLPLMSVYNYPTRASQERYQRAVAGLAEEAMALLPR
ncbi:hypothetical protein ACFXJO_03655 [Streptomyces lavendulae]|uniref:hypothetical protein n=1 Tax=Streptomyces lavendulae TaxID=1914 RepID=UPI0036C07DC5